MSSPISSPKSDQKFIFASNPTEAISEREFTLLLISLYRDLPELWDPECDGYRNKTLKNRAYKKMAETLQKYRPDFDEDRLKKKINALRTNFNKEYNKMNEVMMSGEHTEEQLKPTLWYYNDFLFIKERVGTAAKTALDAQLSTSQSIGCTKIIKTRISNDSIPEETDAVEDSGTIYLQDLKTLEDEQPSTSQSSIQTNRISTRTAVERRLEKTDLAELARRYVQDLKKLESEMDILTKSWAIKLSRLKPDQRLFAEKIINDTLFEAEMGTLTRNGVRFLP